MKKILLSAIVASIATAAVTTANAGVVLDPRPYAGIDYKYAADLGDVINSDLGAQLADKYANSIGVTAGVQLNDYVGVEASIGHTLVDISKVSGVAAKVSTLGLGLTGQYPISDNYYAKALLGASWGRLDVKDGINVHFNTDAEFLGKVGVGYQIDDSNVVEVTYNYELQSHGLGIQYKHFF